METLSNGDISFCHVVFPYDIYLFLSNMQYHVLDFALSICIFFEFTMINLHIKESKLSINGIQEIHKLLT